MKEQPSVQCLRSYVAAHNEWVENGNRENLYESFKFPLRMFAGERNPEPALVFGNRGRADGRNIESVVPQLFGKGKCLANVSNDKRDDRSHRFMKVSRFLRKLVF